MSRPEVTNVKCVFTQEGNTLGTTSDYENLEISLNFQLSEKEGPFYVIRTDGWSFNDISELKEMITKVERILDKG